MVSFSFLSFCFFFSSLSPKLHHLSWLMKKIFSPLVVHIQTSINLAQSIQWDVVYRLIIFSGKIFRWIIEIYTYDTFYLMIILRINNIVLFFFSFVYLCLFNRILSPWKNIQTNRLYTSYKYFEITVMFWVVFFFSPSFSIVSITFTIQVCVTLF